MDQKELPKTGITVPCSWNCGGELVNRANAKDEFNMRMICNKCGKKSYVTSEKKITIIARRILTIGAIVIVGLSLFKTKVIADKVNCSIFKYQQDAQRIFNTNRFFFRSLDRDNDGIACEANDTKIRMVK